MLAGRFYGWLWVDPLMGIVGGLVIARWSWSLMRGAGAVLLETVPDPAVAARIKETIEADGDRVADLHLWRVGPDHMAAIVSLVSDRPRDPAHYKAVLNDVIPLSHLTVEVHRCAPLREAA